MTTKEEILENVKYQESNNQLDKPIYEIMAFEHPDKETIYPTGKHSGFPDTGATAVVGFYHDIDTAIEAVINNVCDIHETVYDAAFILCRFPGLYECVGTEMRLYFVYDAEAGIYVQQEEPEIFRHVAY